MSDLQCPARLFLIRYPEPHVASVGSPGARIDAAGRAQLAALANSLREEHIAAVHHSPYRRAGEAATLLATDLGVASIETVELSTFGVEALADLADQYRGEAVAVVSHSGFMSVALRLVNAPDDLVRDQTGSCEIAELTVDVDGWRLVSWLGQEL